jgi:hypothetical protein
VEIYGVKTERNECDGGKLFKIINCSNNFITAGGNNRRVVSKGNALYHVEDCENIGITSLDNTWTGETEFSLLREVRSGKTVVDLPVSKNVGLFRREDPQK